ncbi:MAG: metallophosphoesterase [Clostridia bacterium]|nr:metallophosphoesterase [Clostridia bacterium]
MFTRERDIEVTYFDIPTPKIPVGRALKFALISDLHSFMYKNGHEDLISLILSHSPDIALLAGDIVDEKVSTRGAYVFAEKIAKRLKSFYVTGNHEYRRNDVPKIKEDFARFGIRVLTNECVRLSAGGCDFILAGLDDERGFDTTEAWLSDAKAALEPLKSESVPKILLIHKPHLVKHFTDYGFDAALSGHTHGGQIRTPFKKRGVYSSGQGLFPELAEGEYDIDGLKLIISRGLAIEPHLPRFFNPPQLVFVTLTGARG